MIRNLVQLTAALEAAAPARAEWLTAYLADQRDERRQHAWHVAEMLIVSEPELLRCVASSLLDHPPSRPWAALTLARLHNRLEEFDALRQVILLHLDNPPASRVEWLRMLLRAELMAPSEDWHKNWSLALPEQPPLAQKMMTFLGLLTREGCADHTSVIRDLENAVTGLELNLPAALRSLWSAKSVAVVGNGPVLLHSGAGAEIESHEFIIRMNFPFLSGYETDTGRRTDLILFHEDKRPIMRELIMREIEFASTPAFSINGSPRHRKANEQPHMSNQIENIVSQLCYNTPSTGLYAAVLVALVMKRRVTMYGFDFFAKGRSGHYFGDTTAAPIHEIRFEQWFIRSALPILCADLRRAII